MQKHSFIKHNRIVSLDASKRKINTESFYEGRVCGTAIQRSNEPKRKKYSLKSEFRLSKPTYYAHLYRQVNETITQLGTEGEMVKKVKTIWKLEKPRYFSWTNPPAMLQSVLTPVADINKKTVPFHSRPFKDFSKFSANKISNKLQMWYLTNLADVNFNYEKIGFKFLTFTVTTPNFDHEKTYRAWKNFIVNMSQRYGTKFQYLWVAELQTGKRSREYALFHFKQAQKGIEVEKNTELYNKFTEAGLNPTNNIHFHMVVDRYYNIQDLNSLWLKCLGNQGAATKSNTLTLMKKKCEVCDNCQKGFACKNKISFHGYANLQPVQLPKKRKNKTTGEYEDHEFKSCESLVRYVAKYMTKQTSDDGEKGIRGALWHCSRMVSKLATSRYSQLIDMNQILKEFSDKLNNGIGDNMSTKHYVKLNKDKTPVLDQQTGKPVIIKPLINYWNSGDGIEIYTFKKLTPFLRHWLKPLIDFNLKVMRICRASSSPLFPKKFEFTLKNVNEYVIFNN